MRAIFDKHEYPHFKECKSCKTIDDCPEPDIEENGLGTPIPPQVCLKPIDVIRATLEKRKKNGTDRNKKTF